MSITYRSQKGSRLTAAELDGNFEYLQKLTYIDGEYIESQRIRIKGTVIYVASAASYPFTTTAATFATEVADGKWTAISSEVNLPFKGGVSIADPALTVPGVYVPSQSGIYTNQGGKVVNLAAGYTTWNFDGVTIKEQVVPIDLVNYAQKTQLDSVEKTSNGNYFIFENKYIDKTGGALSTDGTNLMASTDFIELTVNQFTIIGKGSNGAAALVAFYDTNKTFISAISGASYDNVRTTITSASIPVNAKFIRATSFKSSNLLVIDNFKVLKDKQLEIQPNVAGFTDFSISGLFINSTGGLSGSGGTVCTDFIMIDVQKPFNIRGFSSVAVSLVAFYDINRVFISRINGTDKHDVDNLISVSSIPANAVFIRCSGIAGGKNYVTVKTLSLVEKNLTSKIDASSSNINNQIFGDNFIYQNIFINTTGGISGNSGTIATDYLYINPKNDIKIRGFSGSTACLVVFYDTNKTFISFINGTDKNDIEYTVLSSVIPVNAKYIRCTGTKNGTNYVNASSYLSISAEIKDVVKNNINRKGKYVFGNNTNLNLGVPLQPALASLSITTASTYANYDALMALYPNYITKIDCDAVMLADGVPRPAYLSSLNTFIYKFKPTYGKVYVDNSGAQNYNELEVFIVSGTHPELSGINALFNMMKWVCDSWNSDINAEELRYNVTFYIMPISNPWGVNNLSRTNFNGVDLNRNMPTSNWSVQGSIGSPTYTGATAGSEYESKLLIKYLGLLKPSIFIDVHSFQTDLTGNLMYGSTDSQFGKDLIINSISLISRKLKRTNAHITQNPNTVLGWIDNVIIEGIRSKYACENQILGFTYETCDGSAFKDGVLTGSTQFNMLDAQFNTDCLNGFSTFLTLLLKEFSSNYYATKYSVNYK